MRKRRWTAAANENFKEDKGERWRRRICRSWRMKKIKEKEKEREKRKRKVKQEDKEMKYVEAEEWKRQI